MGTPMRSSPKLRPGFWDGVVALTVVVLAVVCALAFWGGNAGGDDALTAVISVDGAESERIPLVGLADTERTVESNGYTLRIRLTETEVWVESSDCPTQDCIRTGHISRSGQSIVCLPARVIVTLEGGAAADGGVDAVLG